MSREYPDYEILEAVFAGPKQYALKLRHLRTGEIRYIIKCRGITLDKQNEGKLNFETFKDLVFDAYNNRADDLPNPMFDYTRLGPDSNSRVLSRQISKVYRCVNNKGYAVNGTIFPYGF